MNTAMTAVSGAHLWKHSMINSDDHRENDDDLQIQDVVSTYRTETKRIEV